MRITAWFATFVILAAAASAQDERPLFSFGVLADCQYADKDSAGTRYYRKSLSRLRACVEDWNARELAFAIQLGDIVDAGKDSLDPVLKVWRGLRVPGRHVLGNHDFSLPRGQVLGKLGLERGYYDFTVRGWRFVVLDGLDLSVKGGHAKDSETRREAAKMLAKLRAEKAPFAQAWNGGIGAKQLAWLRKTLADASAKQQKVVLACHFPILAAASSPMHLLWNHAEVRALIESQDCVVAWINGHDHAGGYAKQRGVHYVTFCGMVETSDRSAYACVDVFADRLEIHGVGRQPSLKLRLRAASREAKKRKG